MALLNYYILYIRTQWIYGRPKWLGVSWAVLLLISGVQAMVHAQPPKLDKEMDLSKERICIGTTGRMSVPSNRDHHYRNVRDRYTNCTYVDGNLELTWLQDETLDLSFLQHIREVTGYVLISHVNVRRLVLPNLQIIRGRTLFKLNVHDDEFALMVTLSNMHNLEMPSLRDILAGSVGLFNNFNLCHVKTIRWDEIITGPNAKHVYVYNFTEPERECPPCDNSCAEGCWGEGPQNCQQFSKLNCSPQCHQGRCFGTQPRECCHLFCAGGCTGPKQSDCLACRNFYDDGVCKQECPPMQRYNPITYSWESNPEGKYAYGATCVKDCPEHLLKDNGACVRFCPPKKKDVSGECVPCDGPCPKTCVTDDQIHSGNIESFRDCTILEGSLTILESTFNGYQQIYTNFSFGPRYGPIHPDRLEVFSTLKEITGFVNIQAYHPDFKNLSYFRNLEVIGGRSLTEYFSALYIVKTHLSSLNLRSLKKIRAGSVAVLENKNLCFASAINWTKLMIADHNILLHNNKPASECEAEGLVCHVQCDNQGCWGPGDNECLSCRNYQLGGRCVENCSVNTGIYNSGDKVCKLCHSECEHTCSGPGPGNCTKCKHVRDGPYCVAECPQGKYNNSGECTACHENCVGGCTGPNNTVGENGCNSCERAIVRGFKDRFIVERCLSADIPCPNGYYLEWIAPQENGTLKSLSGKSVCKQCDPRCKICSGQGLHVSVCQECTKYKHKEHCEDKCPPEYYPDEENHSCERCANECRECFGPETIHCKACRNYKMSLGENSTLFNCTATCPPDKPYKYFPEENGDPSCTDELPTAAISLGEDSQFAAILGGVLSCIALLGIFLAVFGYLWRQRAKSKENTVKMTMRMTGFEDNEPLKPSNVKPNLAKLRIVKEAELRKGGILGYGAFGTVYKGVWVPEGENVKIPVAIKVLREATGTNTNKEILEEAYIMASMEHPNLLQLLAICMTSQIMLVTQLMPLGCLLDYVRNNKDKIGSKPLLNWCTQIARGMAYLEERRLVHRDLAARNVLVQTPGCIKITDFGLAKLLDSNEDEYKAAGGKMPIKWLALECIQHRIFTHKTDVWAFGVTVWELLTYGGRPYENVLAREVPDLLEKGERLPQPSICTIDVYMIMIKCWMLDAESRPSFKELAEEFAKMARDPGRYLVIPGDKLMRLPSYTAQDEKELIRNLSVATDGPEIFMDAEEYLQPKIRANSNISNNTPQLLPGTKHPSVIDNRQLHNGNQISPARSPQIRGVPPEKKYAYLEAAVANSPSLQDRDSGISTRYSSDPLKLLNKEVEEESSGKPLPKGMESRLEIPVDEDDYLMPSPQPNQNLPTYMDLIGDSKLPETVDGKQIDYSRYIPDFVPVTNRGVVAVDNPEYHVMNNGLRDPNMERPHRKNTSSEEDSDHEYYNDYDRLQRELQPLNHRRSETTV